MSYLIHESNSIFSTLILIVLKRHVPWILKLQYWHGPLDWCCKMQIFNSVCMFIFSQPYFLLSIFFILSKNSLKCLIFTINFFLIYLFSLLRRKIFDNIVVRYRCYACNMRQLEWSTTNTTTTTTTIILTVNNMLKRSNSFINISYVLRYLEIIQTFLKSQKSENISRKCIKHCGLRIQKSYQYPHDEKAFHQIEIVNKWNNQ